jgi:two-component system, NtrC family, sensor kinase
MKLLILTSLIVFLSGNASAQQYLDSLQKQLGNAKEDTTKVLTLGSIADYYAFVQFDSSSFYARQTVDLSEKLNYPYGRYLAYLSLFHASNCKGDYPKALEADQNMLRIADQLKNDKPWVLPVYFYQVGLLNREMGDSANAIILLHQAISLQEKVGEPMEEMFFAFSQLGILYASLNKLDSALFYAQKGYDLGLQSNRNKKYFSLSIAALGIIHQKMGNYKLAEEYFKSGVLQSDAFNNTYFKARNYNLLARLFIKTGYQDSSLYYARISLKLCLEHNFADFTLDASSILAQVYGSQHDPDSTLKYMKIMLVAKDSVYSQAKGQQYQQYIFNEEKQQEEINAAKERYQNRVRIYVLLTILGVFFLLAFTLYRNNRQKQKAKTKIEKAYSELKSTQAQLIQSEKMASLGELTAGIAHEIQNPLNFVNNFSEVSNELMDEMDDELNKGDIDGAKAIANDIKQNLEKINHHGKRADAIVKGMLQHSQSGTGIKEPTNINKLADEYLRLNYHGLRARDKTFNATMKTDFDETIGMVNIIPQNIGRVLLNLYNNAFYAVNERQKISKENLPTGEAGYEPTVSVSTKRIQDKFVLTVKDNGNGISQNIVDKIFQPFFTTKPTGQGTGLGLSLSYDIIKAHDGDIKVETKVGEGTTFIIQLPVV